MKTPTTFEWDETKADANLAKHGFPFEEAVAVFADPFRVVTSTARIEDGEDRQKVVGVIGDRLFAIVFVMRNDVCRIISARRANAKEEQTYGQDEAGP